MGEEGENSMKQMNDEKSPQQVDAGQVPKQADEANDGKIPGNQPTIHFYLSESEAVLYSLENIVSNIHVLKQRNGYRTFLLCGSEPRVGTTSVAINLAISMAMAGWDTILVDGNIRKMSAMKRHGDEVQLGLSDYLAGKNELEDVLYPTNIPHLCHIPSITMYDNPISLICSERMDILLKALAARFDYVIMDFPALSSSSDAAVLSAKADATIMVTAQGALAEVYYDCLENLTEKCSNLLGVIVNKTDLSEYRKSMKHFNYLYKHKYAKKSHAAAAKAQQKG